jgi:DNA repair protein RecO (recombination protein O)
MHIITCEAVVLSVSDLGESDRLVTCFTLEHGKLKGVARGAKRSVKRFGGALEPFARLRLQLTHREGLSGLSGADIITLHTGIRSDLVKIGSAGYACELTERLTLEGQQNQRLFRLLATYLQHLQKSPWDPSDRRFFTINLLKVTGYQPPLEQCASCGVELASANRFCHSSGGGILCDRCGSSGRPISSRTVTLLRRTMQTGHFGVIRFTSEELEETDELLESALTPHLDRPLKSLAFLRETELL